VSDASDRWYDAALKEMMTGDFCWSRGDWRGAYARYGTATEFMLKAIYLRNHQRHDLPSHMRTAASHDIGWLADQAGIGSQVGLFTGSKRAGWLTVRDWDQHRRYPNEPFPVTEARDLKTALLNPTHGIWQWLLSIYLTN
jgi:hypothetical protein